MANPELSQLEKVKNTREVIDPDRRGTLIGTSGIALYFNGFEWPVAPVGDVDLLFPGSADVALIGIRLGQHPRIKEAKFRTMEQDGKTYPDFSKLDVTPLDPKRLLPANLFTAVDDSYFYMSPNEIDRHRVIQSGETTLDLETLLLWKMFALRRKDVRDGTVLTEAAIENELVTPVAANSLRQAIAQVRAMPARNVTESYSYNGI